MHTAQYIDYKSGKAKETFEADLAKRRTPEEAPASAAASTGGFAPKSLNIDVNGEKFKVAISYDGQPAQAADSSEQSEPASPASSANGTMKEVLAPLEAKPISPRTLQNHRLR